MSSIFISHSSKDEAAARSVVEILEDAGLSCWVSYRDIHGGKWADEIAVALTQSQAMVLLLSAHSTASGHVEDEFALAKNRRIPLVAIRLDDAPLPPGLELGLQKWQQLAIVPGQLRQ